MALQNTRLGAERIGALLKNCKGVYFIGIGGVSMCSLAEMTLRIGMAVGGSDRTDSARLDRLRSLGAAIRIGHGNDIPPAYGAVVYTVAISAENPEYRVAAARGLPLISRADYLGWIMTAYRTRIGIAGMHGKSTCTAMCAQIFLSCADPTVLCGAELPSLGGDTCRIGTAHDHVIFEACEYMDSFLNFYPSLAVVLNIGLDHVDYFHSMDQIRESFRRYAEKTGKDGILLYNADDEESVRTFDDRYPNSRRFSLQHPDADFYADGISIENGRLTFRFHENGVPLCKITLPASGRHNVYNALAAAAAARLSGIAPETITRSLATFSGAKRRMERKGTLNGADVYDDYAHHPDEIRATLAGARTLGYRRILCAYQPHTYSRTAGLFREFSGSFADADKIFFVDIYAARETNESGVTSGKLAEAVRENGQDAICTGSLPDTVAALKTEAAPGDLILIMGAGDIENIFQLL